MPHMMNDIQTTSSTSYTWKSARSRLVKAVVYDAARRMLGVKLRHGGLRVYRNVPPEQYTSLISSPSVGQYYDYLQPRLGRPILPLLPAWWLFWFRMPRD